MISVLAISPGHYQASFLIIMICSHCHKDVGCWQCPVSYLLNVAKPKFKPTWILWSSPQSITLLSAHQSVLTTSTVLHFFLVRDLQTPLLTLLAAGREAEGLLAAAHPHYNQADQ